MSTVLLVEDDTSLREGLEEFLQLQGLNVTAVANGVDCFTAIASQSFAVAVVDLGLPDITGQQMVEHLRSCTHTAVIVLTASASLDTRVDSYQRGADLFMGKPVDARELAAAVKSLAARHLPRRESADTAPKPVGVAVWHLNPDHGSLTSPEGTTVRFPAKEFEFVALLGKSAGESVPRNAACQALYGREDESAQAALTTLVRRVRQRITEQGIAEPPVITVHSVGYRFAGALRTPSLR